MLFERVVGRGGVLLICVWITCALAVCSLKIAGLYRESLDKSRISEFL